MINPQRNEHFREHQPRASSSRSQHDQRTHAGIVQDEMTDVGKRHPMFCEKLRWTETFWLAESRRQRWWSSQVIRISDSRRTQRWLTDYGVLKQYKRITNALIRVHCESPKWDAHQPSSRENWLCYSSKQQIEWGRYCRMLEEHHDQVITGDRIHCCPIAIPNS